MELDSLCNGTECAFPHEDHHIVHYLFQLETETGVFNIVLLSNKVQQHTLHYLGGFMVEGGKSRRSTTLCLIKAQYTKVSCK